MHTLQTEGRRGRGGGEEWKYSSINLTKKLTVSSILIV